MPFWGVDAKEVNHRMRALKTALANEELGDFVVAWVDGRLYGPTLDSHMNWSDSWTVGKMGQWPVRWSIGFPSLAVNHQAL